MDSDMNDLLEEDRIGAFRALLRRLVRNQQDHSGACVLQYLQARIEGALVGSTIDQSTAIERVAWEMAQRETLLLSHLRSHPQ